MNILVFLFSYCEYATMNTDVQLSEFKLSLLLDIYL